MIPPMLGRRVAGPHHKCAAQVVVTPVRDGHSRNPDIGALSTQGPAWSLGTGDYQNELTCLFNKPKVPDRYGRHDRVGRYDATSFTLCAVFGERRKT